MLQILSTVVFCMCISNSLGFDYLNFKYEGDYSHNNLRVINEAAQKPTPVVLWHGMGDCCCNPLSIGGIQKFIEQKINNVYVKSIMIGNNVVEDTEHSFFMNANKQVDIVCEQLARDPKLVNGYHAIGFSQGAQFLRAVAQRCPKPRMVNLISLGGQHQGVYGLPHCAYPTHKACDYVRKLLSVGAYWGSVQNKLVQAEYWHDPLKEPEYREKSIFLADINNEKVNNKRYRQNLLQLSNLILVKFENDTMVEPKESSWFSFYTPGQALKITPLNESSLYLEDRLGLQELESSGRLHFLSVAGDHLRFTHSWFEKTIIENFLL